MTFCVYDQFMTGGSNFILESQKPKTQTAMVTWVLFLIWMATHFVDGKALFL